jgi:hypothetical protein
MQDLPEKMQRRPLFGQAGVLQGRRNIQHIFNLHPQWRGAGDLRRQGDMQHLLYQL